MFAGLVVTVFLLQTADCAPKDHSYCFLVYGNICPGKCYNRDCFNKCDKDLCRCLKKDTTCNMRGISHDTAIRKQFLNDMYYDKEPRSTSVNMKL